MYLWKISKAQYLETGGIRLKALRANKLDCQLVQTKTLVSSGVFDEGLFYGVVFEREEDTGDEGLTHA